MPNIERFKKDMEALAKIGRVPEGGVSRFSLTPADIEGRNMTMNIMMKKKMRVMKILQNTLKAHPKKKLEKMMLTLKKR